MAEWDIELIPRETFRELASQGKVIRTPSSHGGIIYEVLKILERNAATIKAMTEMLGVQPKTIMNAIAHLRYRHGKKIIRYYNPRDRKYYYCLED